MTEKEILEKIDQISAKPSATELEYLSAMNTIARLSEHIRALGFDKINKLCAAEREKRCWTAPCKSGDKAYRIHNEIVHEGIIQKVYQLDIENEVWHVYVNFPSLYTVGFRPAIIGENLFLNHEAAEKALEGMK